MSYPGRYLWSPILLNLTTELSRSISLIPNSTIFIPFWIFLDSKQHNFTCLDYLYRFRHDVICSEKGDSILTGLGIKPRPEYIKHEVLPQLWNSWVKVECSWENYSQDEIGNACICLDPNLVIKIYQQFVIKTCYQLVIEI